MIDGNNVMGAGADGWWNDRQGAAERLTQQIALWSRDHDDDVMVVFDGRSSDAVEVLAGGNLGVRFAESRRRDAADDVIVEHVGEIFGTEPDLTVVTSDKGLVARLPPGVVVMGAGAYRHLLGL
ncbi:MAG: NYN domain-containing protein [Microthrixaceae bacterium]